MTPRYCPMCDETVTGAECPACGADTDPIPAVDDSDDDVRAWPRPKMTRANREWHAMSFNRDDER